MRAADPVRRERLVGGGGLDWRFDEWDGFARNAHRQGGGLRRRGPFGGGGGGLGGGGGGGIIGLGGQLQSHRFPFSSLPDEVSGDPLFDGILNYVAGGALAVSGLVIRRSSKSQSVGLVSQGVLK